MKSKSIKYFFAVVLCTIFFASCEKTDDAPSTGSERDKFVGTWAGSSTGSGGNRSFNLTITASNSSSDQILLKNFDGAGANTFIAATVSGNSISLISTLVGQDRYEGTGSLSNGVLSFAFTIDDGQTIENRTATATK